MKKLFISFLLVFFLFSLMFLPAQGESTLILPEGTTEIGSQAFYGDTALDTVQLPEGLLRIESQAFGESSLRRINLPSSLAYIADDAFLGSDEAILSVQPGTYALEWCLSHPCVYMLVDENGNPLPEPTPEPTLPPLTLAYTWELNADQTGAVITGYTGTETELTIPSVINGYPVTEIADNAFMMTSTGQAIYRVTHITVPDSVTVIGDFAFAGCENLESVTLPVNLTKLNRYIFLHCRKLEDVIIPGKVTAIEQSAFEGCLALKHMEIPESVESIATQAFGVCTSLESMLIPASVTNIEQNALYDCELLTVSCYENSAAHAYCISNQIPFELIALPSPYTWELNADQTGAVITGYTGTETKLEIPAKIGSYPVTEIGDLAFDGTGVTEVILPESVKHIGKRAFEMCRSLVSIQLPQGLEGIGQEAFLYCNKLEALVLPAGLKNLGSSAFFHCDLLTEIIVPGGIQEIGEYAFAWCGGLKNAVLSEGVESIGAYAFRYCTGLENITLPETLKTVCDYAFEGLNLKSILIPAGVAEIGENIFNHCGQVTVSCYENSAAHTYCVENEIPFELVKEEIPFTWEIYGNDGGFARITGYTGMDSHAKIPAELEGYPVREIGERAFYNCTALESVTIPGSVKTIGYLAFSNCTALNNVYAADMGSWLALTVDPSSGSNPMQYAKNLYIGGSLLEEAVIPGDITSIRKQAFRNCTSLLSVRIPQGVTGIGSSAFYGCENLAEITLPEGVKTIGGSAFYNCKALQTLEIPGSVTEIGGYAFAGCSGLTAIALPDGITRLLSYTFASCSNLKQIVIPGTVTEIQDYVFSGCAALTAVSIPGSVKTIGESAFSKCIYLADVKLNEGLETIETSAFEECYSLKKIILPQGLTAIGQWAFYRCTALADVTVPSSVTSIAGAAFMYCSNSLIISCTEGSTAHTFCQNGNIDFHLITE